MISRDPICSTVHCRRCCVGLLILIVLLGGTIHAQVASELQQEAVRSDPDADQTSTQLERERRQAEMLQDPRLTASGEPRWLRGEHLEAVEFPVGGIGSGGLLLDGTGRRRAWQLDYNFSYAAIPDSFFAVRARAEGEPAITRALQTVAQGRFKPMKSVSLLGEFPFARYQFVDTRLPIQIDMEVFNPFIPLDEKNSAIPCAIYRFTLTNPCDTHVQVSVLGAQQNLVGYEPTPVDADGSFDAAFEEGTNIYRSGDAIVDRRHESFGGNVNQVVGSEDCTRLRLTTTRPEDGRAYGSMVLGILGDIEGTGTASWDTPDTLYADFHDDGSVSGPQSADASPDGATWNGALACSLTLQPGQSGTVCFVLTWHFPNAVLGGIRTPNWSARAWGGGGWGGVGPMYRNWWSDADAVLDYVVARYDELDQRTRRFHETLYETSLPYWLRDRLSGRLGVLKSQSVFWTADNYVGGWEGVGSNNGSCAGNCSHVWHYAQAHARLFPRLARLMREQEFSVIHDDGGIPFRQPDNQHVAFDAQCGIILAAYREHLMGGDDKWLAEHYGTICRAIDFMMGRWDQDERGWLAGAQHTTLDCALSGNSSWMGSMYVAALMAGEQMALRQGDTTRAERYRQIHEAARRLHEKLLWNGEYYAQVPGESPGSDYNSGCATDQLLGQWWAWQLGLGDLYEPDRMTAALTNLFRYNFRPDFHELRQAPREFVTEDDAGMQMITWPLGGRPAKSTSYADEVMSGFEYAAAACMFRRGLAAQALTVLMAIDQRYDGRLRTGFKPGWGNFGYTGNPFGDDECGKFYSRSLSIWSVLLIAQGYHYDGPRHSLSFDPVWQPDEHRSLFTTSAGWGLFTQTRTARKQHYALRIDRGELTLAKLTLSLTDDLETSEARCELKGRPVAVDATVEGRRLVLEFQVPVTIAEGTCLDIAICK